MEFIKAILANNGIETTEAEIRKTCAEFGIDPDTCTNDEGAAIAEVIIKAKAKSGLAKGGAKKGKLTREQKTVQLDLKSAAQTTAQEVQGELATMVATMKAGSERFAQKTSEEMLEIITETPNLTLEMFADKARRFAGNPDHFQKRTQELADIFFPVGEES